MRAGIVIVIAVLCLGFVFWKDIDKAVFSGSEKDNNKKEKKGNRQQEASSQIGIVQQWSLPSQLKEVSGIAYMDAQRFACVQDEEGVIFIFNKETNQIEQQIPFAGPGDYEGLTLNGNIAYVVRADGTLYEVDVTKGKSSVKEYNTPFSVKNNVEGLCYDADNSRLLLAVKDENLAGTDDKGIYAFPLSSKALQQQPVITIAASNPAFADGGKKKKKGFMPSAIGIHPTTKEVYVVDGPHSRLLVMDKKGEVKNLYQLGKAFAQPEGITFSPQGDVYISNEGTKQAANIIQVSISESEVK